MNNKKIALTGGIGSGKSTALALLKNSGFITLTSDGIVSDLYKKNRIKRLLKRLFPTAVKGLFCLKIDRAEISKLAFSNPEKHKALTDTITPLVLKEIIKRSNKIKSAVFVEVPLLFECGYEKYFDQVIVITRPIKNRIESVKVRSNLTEEQILARINKQINYDNKDLSSYHVIVNDGDEKALKDKVLSLANTLIK